MGKVCRRPIQPAGASLPVLSIPIRLALFYGAYFLAIGVMLPFWPAWLASRGLGPVEIGAVLAVAFWVKVVAHPTVAGMADATGAVRALLTTLAVGSVCVFALFGLAEGFWAFALLAGLGGICFQTILPVGEATALAAAKAGGHDYGRIRVWGSITFILAALGVGALIDRNGPEMIWISLLGALVLLVGACALLPGVAGARTRKPWSWSAMMALAGTRSFLLFTATAGAVQISHAVYYGFGTIIWQRMGFPETAIGTLWTLGVVAEIVLFWFAGRLGRFGSARALLALAITGAILRWGLTPFADSPWTAAPLQLLHALTFGAAHLGAMRYLQDNAPEELGATAQALYYALVGGVLMGCAMPLGGWLYQSFDTLAYLAMALVSTLALIPLALLGRVQPALSSSTADR